MKMYENTRLPDLWMFIIDVLRYDIEPISSIVNLLNDDDSIGWREFWPADFAALEVAGALEELVARRYVQPLTYDPNKKELVESSVMSGFIESPEDYWFLLMKAGRELWESWEPPTASPPSKGSAK
jgi:hypothetical protein